MHLKRPAYIARVACVVGCDGIAAAYNGVAVSINRALESIKSADTICRTRLYDRI